MSVPYPIPTLKCTCNKNGVCEVCVDEKFARHTEKLMWIIIPLMIVASILIGFIIGNGHGFKTAMKAKNLDTIRQVSTCKQERAHDVSP